MISHDFVDPELVHYWKSSCKIDSDSAGCRYFIKRYQDNIQELNPYSIYFQYIIQVFTTIVITMILLCLKKNQVKKILLLKKVFYKNILINKVK